MSRPAFLPQLVLGIGVVAVSWSAILVRQAEAPALVIAAYRMVLAGLPVGALALIEQRRSPVPVRRDTARSLLLAAAFLAAHFGFWISSLQHTSVVTAVVLMATQPLFVAIASPLLLREALERRVWAGLAVAVGGTALMAAEDMGEGLGTVAGDVYAVLGGAFAAGYIMVGRWARPDVSWARYVGVVYPVTAVFLLGTVLIAGEPFTGYSTKTLVMIGLLALGPQLIGHSSINWSLAYLPAVVVAIAILVEPVAATALAALILDERPSAFEIVGSLFVLLGVYLALRPGREEIVAIEATAADAAIE